MSSLSVLTDEGPEITSIFNSVAKGIQDIIDSRNHGAAVDLELQFNQVTINSKGVPLFSKTETTKSIQIKLATRITPK